MENRLDNIMFDLKETLDDLANELKLLNKKYKELDKRTKSRKIKKI